MKNKSPMEDIYISLGKESEGINLTDGDKQIVIAVNGESKGVYFKGSKDDFKKQFEILKETKLLKE